MAELAVQKGLFEALSGIGPPVYDVLPQRADGGDAAEYPCIAVGAVVLAPWDTKDNTGFDFVARVHSWSRDAAMSEVKGLQRKIYERLHRGVIAVEGYRLIDLGRRSSTVLEDQDGTFHGVCEYRGLIETIRTGDET